MRREIELWWLQAKKDFSVAEILFDKEQYYMVAFLCQQSIEKGLKALHLKKNKRPADFTHSLVTLGNACKVPNSLMVILRNSTLDFVISRYPDASDELPYEMYDKTIASQRIDGAREVLKWIEKELEI